MLFAWYTDGDTPSEVFDGFKLSEPSARFFDAIGAARAAAGDKDVALMGGGVLTSTLEADLVDEVILHQVPVLPGAGHSFFHELPKHVRLRLLEAIPAPGVTHLHHEVIR
jgi:dihydrofolate reductase